MKLLEKTKRFPFSESLSELDVLKSESSIGGTKYFHLYMSQITCLVCFFVFVLEIRGKISPSVEKVIFIVA